MGLNIFKLEKLKILSFKTADRSENTPPEFEAMFNPTEIEWKYEHKWGTRQAANSEAKPQRFSYTQPTDLAVKLMLDGTNTDEMGAFTIGRPTVLQRVEQFKKIAYTYDGDIHEPPYLRIVWGSTVSFNCRLCKFGLKYTMFDRDGSPLRAELDLVFHYDTTADMAAKAAANKSPDMTHARVVHAGDTLPLLTASIYGAPTWYVDVARFNGLDDFRVLKPGQELLFPPLAVFTKPGDTNSERR